MGHRVYECPQRQSSWKAPAVICDICGESTHLTIDCKATPGKNKLSDEYNSFMSELMGGTAAEPSPTGATGSSGSSSTTASSGGASSSAPNPSPQAPASTQQDGNGTNQNKNQQIQTATPNDYKSYMAAKAAKANQNALPGNYPPNMNFPPPPNMNMNFPPPPPFFNQPMMGFPPNPGFFPPNPYGMPSFPVPPPPNFMNNGMGGIGYPQMPPGMGMMGAAPPGQQFAYPGVNNNLTPAAPPGLTPPAQNATVSTGSVSIESTQAAQTTSSSSTT